MRIMVTGAAGMLGQDVVKELSRRGIDHTPYTHSDLDITNYPTTCAAVEQHDIVINCAAYTQVDQAETNPLEAMAVNGQAVAHLAHCANRHHTTLIHISSDYVFNGSSRFPYRINDLPNPINVYGWSKLAGEQAVLHHAPGHGYVIRTEWMYGAGGRNFVSTILDLATRMETISVVDDQVGQPTWSLAVAERLIQMGISAHNGFIPPGIHHLAAQGQTTWFDFAQEILTQSGQDPNRIIPTNSASLQRPAKRPKNSVLAPSRWGTPPLNHWHQMLVQSGLAKQHQPDQ